MTHSPVTLVTLYLCAILTHFQVLLSLVDVIDYVIWELFLEIGVCNTEQHYPLSLSLSLSPLALKNENAQVYIAALQQLCSFTGETINHF